MAKLQFFGYGAYRSREKVTQIIGRDPGPGIGAILEGFSLYIQTLKQIPNPPRDLLREVYGSTFQAYTLRNEAGEVQGMLWEIEPEEFNKIKQWEFIGIWRELVKVTIKTSDNLTLKVFTEKSPDIHPVAERADGLNYKEFNLIRIQKAPPQFKKDYDRYTKIQIEAIKKWLKLQQ